MVRATVRRRGRRAKTRDVAFCVERLDAQPGVALINARVMVDSQASGWEMIYADDVAARRHPQGDRRIPEQRQRLVLRNRLWTMWLRRSPGRAALIDALRGSPWIVRERRPIDRNVEKLLAAMTELPA